MTATNMLAFEQFKGLFNLAIANLFYKKVSTYKFLTRQVDWPPDSFYQSCSNYCTYLNTGGVGFKL